MNVRVYLLVIALAYSCAGAIIVIGATPFALIGWRPRPVEIARWTGWLAVAVVCGGLLKGWM